MFGRRSRHIAGPAIALATAGAIAGGITAGLVSRRRRRSRRRAPADPGSVVRRLLEEPWRGGVDVVDELVSADYVGHDSAEPEPIRGPEALRSVLERYVAAFPDGSIQIDEHVVQGDRVATRWTRRGTHTGDLAGIAATGKDVTVAGMTISRVAGGRIVSQWTTWDRHALLVQLGTVTEPARAS